MESNQQAQKIKDVRAHAGNALSIGWFIENLAEEISKHINIISLRLQLLDFENELSDIYSRKVCENQLEHIVSFLASLGRTARFSPKKVTMTNLNEVVQNIFARLGNSLSETSIQVEMHSDPDLPLILMDKSHIEEAIQILASKVAASMGNHKTRVLRLMTEPGNSEQYVQLVISDIGTDNRGGKMFQPFCSSDSQALMLQLFRAYSIIEEHNGRVWAENNKYGGTSCYIVLPVVLPRPTREAVSVPMFKQIDPTAS